MIRTNYREVEELARKVDSKLLAYDFGSGDIAFIIHEEGSTLLFQNAFVREFKDYIIIFTEHHGTHVYHRGNLSHWGQYAKKDNAAIRDTGYKDTCEFCGKEADVADLIYNTHPNWDEYVEGKYHSYCSNCRDVENSKYRDLWRYLNEKDWGFVWGKDDIEHVKKALATIIKEDEIDKWLDTKSPAFKKTPRFAIEQGDIDKIYLMAYQCGSGEFL